MNKPAVLASVALISALTASPALADPRYDGSAAAATALFAPTSGARAADVAQLALELRAQRLRPLAV